MTANPTPSTAEPKATLNRKRTWIVFVSCAIGVLAASCLSPSWIASASTRKGQVRDLSGAHTPETVRNAVGRLGVVLPRKDGSWIAISYKDSHMIPFAYSSAIVRTSEGEWMRSTEHFCGAFANYRNQRDLYSSWRDKAQTDAERLDAESMLQQIGQDTLLDDIERASSMSEATNLLRRMGFSSMSTPR